MPITPEFGQPYQDNGEGKLVLGPSVTKAITQGQVHVTLTLDAHAATLLANAAADRSTRLHQESRQLTRLVGQPYWEHAADYAAEYSTDATTLGDLATVLFQTIREQNHGQLK